MPVIEGGLELAGANRFYTDFKAPPIFSKKGGGAPTGVAGDQNLLWVPGSVRQGHGVIPLEYFIIGTQTIVAPVQTAVGLNIGMDQTASDGIEIAGGVLTRGPFNGVLGTDSFFIKVKAKIEDASGAGKFLVGFRRAEAFVADWNNYLDLVAIGINGTANPNTITMEKILNNAATVSVSTTNTWADGVEKSLTCIIGRDRKALFQIDDAAPTVVTTFTGDDTDPYVPFILFTHAADVAGTVELTELDIRVG